MLKWFTLRGRKYMYDKGWWRQLTGGEPRTVGYQYFTSNKVWQTGTHDMLGVVLDDLEGKSGEYRVPCEQPFRCGDTVRVVGSDHNWFIGDAWWSMTHARMIGQVYHVAATADSYVTLKGVKFPPHCLEGAEDAKPTELVEVKISPAEAAFRGAAEVLTQEESDRLDEIIEKGLAKPTIPIPPRDQVEVPNAEEWELYVPIKKRPYDPGTQCKHRSSSTWFTPNAHYIHGSRADDTTMYDYRRPRKPAVPPKLDNCMDEDVMSTMQANVELLRQRFRATAAAIALKQQSFTELGGTKYVDIKLSHIDEAAKTFHEALDMWSCEPHDLVTKATDST